MIKFFPDATTVISVGPLTVTWYALLIMTGAMIAYAISKRNLKKVGYNEDIVDDIFVGVLIFGFLGARLWYVLFYDLASYLKDPIRIFAITEGGLAIQGGLLAGVLFGYIYAKRKNINFIQIMDLIVPNVLIAQALGRWGNFVNQEAYGGVVSESFFNGFPVWIKEMMFINGNYHHPTFLYESVANIIGWILIVLVLKRFSRVKRGDLTFAYMMWYGVTRFFIEGLRTDSLYFFNIRIAQLISVIFLVVGLVGYLGGFKRFMKSEKPVILWDFDGTLADTRSAIIESFVHVFKTHKPEVELTDELLASFMGPSLEDTFEKHFPDFDQEMLLSQYREFNLKLHDTHVTAVPNALNVLQTLKDLGYVQAIVSNKNTEVVELGIDTLKMRDYFDVVVGRDQFKESKPAPDGINKALELLFRDRSQVVMIGDSVADVESGKRAGSFTIGFLFDKIREDELRNSNPNRLITDLNEVLEILKEEHEWTTTMM